MYFKKTHCFFLFQKQPNDILYILNTLIYFEYLV